MRKKILFLSIALLLFCLQMQPRTSSDSIARKLPHLQGKAKLQALQNLYDLSQSAGDTKKEWMYINWLIKEAKIQKDYHAECSALNMRDFSYYNQNLSDSLSKNVPQNLEKMAKYGCWADYYDDWYLLVKQYVYSEKKLTALREAKLMYADARRRGSKFGLGVSAYLCGFAYIALSRNKEAVPWFRYGIRMMRDASDRSVLWAAYADYCFTLRSLRRFAELEGVVNEWSGAIDKYNEEQRAMGRVFEYSSTELSRDCEAAEAYIGLGKLDRAESYIRRIRQHASIKGTDNQIAGVESHYFLARGDYQKALQTRQQSIRWDKDNGLSLLAYQEGYEEGDILMKMGAWEAAAKLYKSLNDETESINGHEQQRQIDEMQTIYKTDELKVQRRQAILHTWIALGGCLILLIFCSIYVVMNRHLKRKNKALFKALRDNQDDENEKEREIVGEADKKLTSEMRLYRDLCLLMTKEQLWKDPQLKRDELASRLGTNRTYVVEAVKVGTNGKTVTDFINSYRLRNASELLLQDAKMPMVEIAEKCGFNYRSTFGRIFYEYYGMSPSAFRKEGKNKRTKENGNN